MIYLLVSQEDFRHDKTISSTVGICAAVVLFAVHLIALFRHKKKHYEI